MKNFRIIALLLAVVLVLTSFSGSLVFAANDDATAAGDTTASDAATTSDDAGSGTEGGDDTPGVGDDGRIFYKADAMVPLTADTPDYSTFVAAATKAADGREVSISPITMEEKIAVPSTNADFVGVATFNASDGSMTLLKASFSGKPYSYYDATEATLGQTVYYLEVASISESDLTMLSDPKTSEAEKLAWKIDKRGLFKSAEQRVRAMTKYFENSNRILYADDQLGEIAVYNKQTKQYYFSTPYDYRRVAGVSSNDTRNQIASLMEVSYYDNSANRKTLTSYADAVAKTSYAETKDDADNIQFTHEKIDNGVRFTFNIGTQKVDSLLPYASEKTVFEEKILKPLQEQADAGSSEAAAAVKKFNTYYTLYHYADLSASMQRSLSTNYPGIVNYDFYVLRGVVDREKKILSDCVKMGGVYSWEDYYRDLELSEYVPEDQTLACFTITVDFTIDGDDLIVNVPTGKNDKGEDLISYDQTSFTLQSITLMHYFGCGEYTNDGYVFVPDGSGSIINFNTKGDKKGSSLIKPVYGKDYALGTETSYTNLSQSAYLPVYGLKDNDRAYLAIIEKGDAMATIQSESGNFQSSYETVYSTFVYNTVQKITYSNSGKQDGDFTYFNKNAYHGDYQLRFKLLSGKNVSYVDMAKAYREYLLKNDLLITKVNTSGSTGTPLVLETLGLIDKKTSTLGIVYNKKIPLTSFDAAQDMMNELADGGVQNIALRYRGWMNGGLNYSVPSKLKIEGKLGGKSGFKDLISYMDDKNYTLFPEVDFCVVRRDGTFDGYRTSSDAPKATDRSTVTLTPRNELDNILYIWKDYFAVSPTSSTKYFKSFFNKYTNYTTKSVSIGTVGSMLYSDFSTGKKATHRQQAVETLANNVSTYVTGNGFSRVMVEGGNAYTWNYATDIVDIPLCDSNTFQADAAVPFMQIVLHGHIQYAGDALNLSDDMTDTILKSAEYGANLHFTLSAENTRELKDTVYSNYYTIDFDTWKSDVLELYGKFNRVFASLQDQEITNHEASTSVDGVYITTYANGTRIAVNYNREQVTVEGKTIAAQDFTVL